VGARSRGAHPRCSKCHERIEIQRQGRPTEGGRLCNKCDIKARKHKKETSARILHLPPPPLLRTASAPARLRTLAPLSTLTASGQRHRKRKAEALLEQVQVPAGVLSPARIPPTAFLRTSTRFRNEMRRVLPSVAIPGEKAMATLKEQIADTKGTATASFDCGAYLTDPLRFVSVLTSHSEYLVIGGDFGSHFTKIGVTYFHNQITHFAPLLIYEGKDDWEHLAKFLSPSVPPFSGDSAHFPSIWAFLQFLVESRNALLNGDWMFLNNVLGLMAAAAKYPCPICTVSSDYFLRVCPYRTAKDKHSRHASQYPLLTVPSDRIVPLPLHVLLGLSNRLIFNVFPRWFPPENITQLVSTVKTVHTTGCGGLSDLYDLNGPEIIKWIKSGCNEKLLASVRGMSTLNPSVRAAFSSCCTWMQQLHTSLLHTREWTAAQIAEWESTVQHILSHWKEETGTELFPKVHMLRHTAEFLTRHRVLGRVSEAQIESCHSAFTRLFDRIHLNSAANKEERIRRCLADLALQKIANFVDDENKENENPNSGTAAKRPRRTSTV
jgi:hypothetical protein